MTAIPQKLKTIGLYVIIMLAVVRFFIVPMQSSLKAKKLIFADKIEVYNTKKSVLERQEGGTQKDAPPDKEKPAELFYPKDQPASAIQAELINDLIDKAEKKGLTVASFELPEVIAGKSLTEANVIFRFSGRALVVNEFLGELERNKKRLNIKVFETDMRGEEQFVNMTITAFRLGGI